MTRRHGMLGQRAVKLIATVLAFGMIAGIAAPYLLQAGFPLWTVLLLVLIVLAVPVVAVLHSERSRR
ncbi:hypothetical protein SAMN05421805_10266 [Saccharopolyspora antimicrobica]|uniref:Uncharacterized protein n=1 Tax=Saccharopolyspora antimicrobica TaxID=455193 RepID=A0A1I4V8P7_9PSEU|nr:hypothetical protein [Saccharopolyspora antimicrobica]RKT86173.1 hypothetical protein ATL45_4533 [Saccharopolyspora antimicrobica]SFM97576.1 hypothetical protein SAMN05421805_10266 [Saccharopolyspora antimicrobica]